MEAEVGVQLQPVVAQLEVVPLELAATGLIAVWYVMNR